jgi:ATP-dependent Clp protease ATP-binding subunit ClpA
MVVNMSLPLTDQAIELLSAARQVARSMGHAVTEPAHIILAVTAMPRSHASDLLEIVAISAGALSSEIRQGIEESLLLPCDDERRVVERAEVAAARRGCPGVDTDDLLLASLELSGPVVRRAFERLSVSFAATVELAKEHVDKSFKRGCEITRLLAEAE